MNRRKNKVKAYISAFLPMVILSICLVIFTLLIQNVSSSNKGREKELLSKALDRSITQCYALEGAYPSSLHYLEEHYGLTYNDKHFFIDYQYIGANLRPDTTIIERE